jgi:hypothetical protein
VEVVKVVGGTNVNAVTFDACELYPNPEVWEAVVSPGDLILQRGNTAGAGWIEISKSPFSANTETVLTYKPIFSMPIKITNRVSLTHRNAGESIFSQEFVSDDAAYGGEPISEPVPVEILNASQSGSVITINFEEPPERPFRAGQVVSIYGFVDTRLNVNSVTVSDIVTPTQITVSGNDYTPTSTTITTTLGNGQAFIERVDQLGGARNGLSIVRSNGTATNARFYVRSQGGVSRPSGTLLGSHNVTVGTDVSTALAAGIAYAESWAAPLETVMLINRDGVYVGDRAPDAGSGLSKRYTNSQVVPNPIRPYFQRFRVRSTPSLTRPLGKIASISKAGSTLTTIVTEDPHGCLTGQYVGFYGPSNQANFANQTTGLLCTVINENTLTITHGALATATSYGGFLMRVQGQQPLGGAIAQVAQSVSRTGNIVTVVGNATWAAPTVIGNLVEAIGLRDSTTGADLGLDGTYVVRDLVTSTMILEPVPGAAPTGNDIASTPCGGGFVQRFGARIHGLVSTDYDPLLTEFATKGNSDSSESTPVVGSMSISGTVTTSLASTTISGGQAAHDAAVTGNPMRTAGRAVTANYAAVANGDTADIMTTTVGAQVVRPHAIPEAVFNYTGALTLTTDVAVQAAAGGGLRRHPVLLDAHNSGVSDVDLILSDGTTVRQQYTIKAGTSKAVDIQGMLVTTANTALNAKLSAAGTVRLNMTGYTAP